MIRKIALLPLVLLALIIPLSASAQATMTLQQEVANLLQEVGQETAPSTPASATPVPSTTSAPATTVSSDTSPTTDANVTPAASGPVICPTIVRTLSIGSSGTDVANLQGFLAQNPIIYPEGAVTAYFGILTQDAVERWQSAYHIVSSGTPATTGYGVVGPRTAAAIAASCQSINSNFNLVPAPTNLSGTVSSSPSEQQPLCPIAPQPLTPCAGTWSPLTNATGCTIAWQCSTPLPGVTAVPTSATSAATNTATCAAYTMPLCTNGRLQWLGLNSAGCNLGYECI